MKIATSKDGRVCLNAFGTLFTVKLARVCISLRHTDSVTGCGDDLLHTLSEDDYLNEPQIFPPDST